jgi:hypothetical protein
MYRYEVGKLYHPDKRQWQERGEYNYRSNAHELRLFFSGLTHSDIRRIRNGSCTFSFAVTGDIIWFFYEFGKACPWSDNSYSIHLVPSDERTIPPELAENEQAILTIILVSSEDGIIKALRQIKLGHDFSVALHTAIREQASQSFNQIKYDAQIAEVYRKYPTTKILLQRAQATCIVKSSNLHN